jgi:phenylalanyl-tRNA synthetase beta chain
MGGLDTEVSGTTTTILLEDAYFNPVSVRTTSRKLVLPSEAAYRFERIVDIENIDWASKRTAQLIIQVAGGKVAKGVVDVYPRKCSAKQVTLRLSRLSKLLGLEIPPERTVEILSGLGFEPQLQRDSALCSVPSWRSDIYREVDLIEEVGRAYGYDKIPTRQKIEIEATAADVRHKLTESIVQYLNGCGFYETVTISFVDDKVAAFFKAEGSKGYLSVKDVSRKGASVLRQVLLGSLLSVYKTNLNVGNLPCRIFEFADTYVPTGKVNELPLEKNMLSLVCDSDLRDLHGVIEGLVQTIDRQARIEFDSAELPWAEIGATVVVNGVIIGTTGIFSRAIKEHFDFKAVIPCGAELEFDRLMGLRQGTVRAKSIPRYPAIVRDLSLVVDEHTPWANIAKAVEAEAPPELESIRFVGIYRGDIIPSGKKSVTFSLRFRDEDGTLTHEMVDRFQVNILHSLSSRIGAELRTA